MTKQYLHPYVYACLFRVLEPIGQHRRVVAESKRKKQKGDDATTTTPAYPDIHQRVCIGINDVTKLLENAIQSKTKRPNTAIFVCKRDMKPPHLCSHLLTMAPLTSTKIVSLPQGAEIKLAKALGLQRASCIAVDVSISKDDLDTSLMYTWLDCGGKRRAIATGYGWSAYSGCALDYGWWRVSANQYQGFGNVCTYQTKETTCTTLIEW